MCGTRIDLLTGSMRGFCSIASSWSVILQATNIKLSPIISSLCRPGHEMMWNVSILKWDSLETSAPCSDSLRFGSNGVPGLVLIYSHSIFELTDPQLCLIPPSLPPTSLACSVPPSSQTGSELAQLEKLTCDLLNMQLLSLQAGVGERMLVAVYFASLK